jgi:HD-like signal output (HDOD) protein/CheY-like chemotaxis protein
MRISEAPANILLVTDDPSVFDLRERLSDAHELWGISSVSTAQKALNQLEGDTVIDAVVVGHRIADTDSRALLEALRSSYPDVARIAITQSPTAGRALESARAADGAIEFPVDVEILQHVIERAVTLKWRLNDPQLRQLLLDTETLPSPPPAIAQLSAALADTQVEIPEVAKIIESDPAMTAKLMQLVNSASFGLAQQMTNIDQIVAYLGLSTVRNMLTAVELLSAFHVVPDGMAQDVELHRLHAMDVAELAQALPRDRREQHEAFAAGMLHDIGLLALMTCAPARYLALKAEVQNGRDLESSELDVLGASHSTIGAHLLEQWLLPTGLCEAVARSHDADMMSDHAPNAIHAVFVAEQLAGFRPESPWWEPGAPLAESYLEALGWTESARA